MKQPRPFDSSDALAVGYALVLPENLECCLACKFADALAAWPTLCTKHRALVERAAVCDSFEERAWAPLRLVKR